MRGYFTKPKFFFVVIIVIALILFSIVEATFFSENLTLTVNELNELKQYTLDLINRDRTTEITTTGTSLHNLTLSSVSSAQIHAEEMLALKYFSHWDTNGEKPYMRYTKANGTGGIVENIAIKEGLYTSVESVIASLELNMMYNDADSNWGHKENILSPFHNKVAIGIAYDSTHVYLVEDFENDYIQWSNRSVINNYAILSGQLSSGLSLDKIEVRYDNVSALTTQQLNEPMFSGGYTRGKLVALVNSYEDLLDVIAPVVWNQTQRDFKIVFDLTPTFLQHGEGVYTLYLYSGNDFLSSYSIFSIR